MKAIIHGARLVDVRWSEDFAVIELVGSNGGLLQIYCDPAFDLWDEIVHRVSLARREHTP